MYTKLTKKDIIAFNKQLGEQGITRNESSLDFALSIAKTKKNWLYELSYLTRSLLIDHVFVDGNKRTALLVVIFDFDENKKQFDRNQLLRTMKIIAQKNITNPLKIMRLLYNVVREKNK